MRAAWAYFVSFQQAAKDFARFSQTKLTMPVLSIGGEKANGDALGQQLKIVASNAKAVTLPNTGHWVMEENPQGTMDALVSFLGSQATTVASPNTPPSAAAGSSTLAQMRLTPDEIRANQTGSGQIGSALVAGVSTHSSIGRSIEGGVLHDRAVGSGEYHDCCALASRRSDGDRRLWHLAVRLWRSVR